MISQRAQLLGALEAIRVLQQVPEAFDTGVEEVARKLKELAEGRTPRKSGHLKDSWGQVTRHRGGFSFSNPVDYAIILEEGLYPTVGPRTSPGLQRTGIFSRQAIDGILWPLVNEERNITAMAELVVEQLTKGLQRAGA